MNAVSPKERCVIKSAVTTPASERGTAIIMMTGCRNDSNCEASNM